MMAIAIIFAISFLPPINRRSSRSSAGAGFGWFIDELGKFITRDVNYFFQPTIALIYIMFIVMYSCSARIQRATSAPTRRCSTRSSAESRHRRARASHQRRAAIALLDSDRCRRSARRAGARRCSSTCRRCPPPNPNRFEQLAVARTRRGTSASTRAAGGSSRVVTCWFVVLAVGHGGRRGAARARPRRDPRLRGVGDRSISSLRRRPADRRSARCGSAHHRRRRLPVVRPRAPRRRSS